MKKFLNWLTYCDEGGPDFADAPMPNWVAILLFALFAAMVYCVVKA